MSSHYYVRLERGNLAGVSDSVVDALTAAVPQLTGAERQHPHDLGASITWARSRPASDDPHPCRVSVQAMLEAMTGAPAVVRNDRPDLLATNRLGRALYSDLRRSSRTFLNQLVDNVGTQAYRLIQPLG